VLVATMGARATLFIAGAAPAVAGIVWVGISARARAGGGAPVTDLAQALSRSG
jgi:hypothetical protein